VKFLCVAPSVEDFKVSRKRTLAQFGAAVARAVDTTIVNAHRDVTGAMAAARLGKLAKAVKSTSDLRKRRVPDIGEGVDGWRVGGVIYAARGSDRTTGALEAYLQQAVTTIIPKHGRWLAIATDEIPTRAGRRRMTPELYLSSGLDRRIGRLHFLPSKSKPGEAFLVVKNVQVDAARGFGRGIRLPKHGRARPGRTAVDFIIAFILIRRTMRIRRVDPLAILRRRANDLPAEIRKNLRGSDRGAIRGPIIASSSGSFE
jgi:hypothetical protein